MEHSSSGLPLIMPGDVVEVAGYLDEIDGLEFIAESVKAHPDMEGLLVYMSKEDTLKYWNLIDPIWVPAGEKICWWSGFLINHGQPELENI